MYYSLQSSDRYVRVDYSAALSNAKLGGLSLYSSLGLRHGHVGSFSVGDNMSRGETANIGLANGYIPLHRLQGDRNPHHGVYSFNEKNILFFILKTK